jgi:hypothetical protein
MPRRGLEPARRARQRQAALSRWDNEGGAGAGGKPQEAAGSRVRSTAAEERHEPTGPAEPAPADTAASTPFDAPLIAAG